MTRARALLSRLLDQSGVEAERKADALLVASELVTNAVSHGSRSSDEVGIEFKVDNGRISIAVRDALRGHAVPQAFSPDEQRPAGRGLNIVERLANWSERVTDGRREVHAELRL